MLFSEQTHGLMDCKLVMEKIWSLILGRKKWLEFVPRRGSSKLTVGVCFSVLKSRLVIGWSLLFSEATHVIDEIWSLILGDKIVGICFWVRKL